MMKKILVIGIISIVALLIVAYLFNLLAFWGLCKPGDRIGRGLGPKFCYTPSGFAGNPCDKKSDCGTGGCALIDSEKTIGKGICRDLPFGCTVWIDKDGDYDEINAMCVD